MTEAPAAEPAGARVAGWLTPCAAAVDALFARPHDAADVAAVRAEAAALVDLDVDVDAARRAADALPEPTAHALRVAVVAVALGRRLGLAPPFLRALALGALLHDLGSALVPAPADAAARRALERQHPTVGADLLRAHGPLDEVVRAILIGHHERLDGTGYPFALEAASVPLAARLVGLVDLHDTLTHDRPGRPAVAPDRALALLRGPLAPQVDADLVAELEALLATGGAA